MIFFTSDLHMRHKNILKYSNRPFDTIDEMNVTILNNINNTVMTNDQLYILGDFCFGSVKICLEYLDKIKCRNITFVQGNHDNRRFINKLSKNNIDTYTLKHKLELPLENKTLLCTHFPEKTIPENYINLHGHIHTEGNHNIITNNFYDVGVDNNNFKPISLEQIKNIMKF